MNRIYKMLVNKFFMAVVMLLCVGVMSAQTWNSSTPPIITGNATVTIAVGAGGTLIIPDNAIVTINSIGSAVVDIGYNQITLNTGTNGRVTWRANYNSYYGVNIVGTGTFEVAAGTIRSSMTNAISTSSNCTIIVSGGEVIAPWTVINSSGTSGTVRVSGGLVNSTNRYGGQAIIVEGTLNVTGGLVIAQKNDVTGWSGVVSKPPTGSVTGTIIGYTLGGSYTSGATTDLVFLPAIGASVSWGLRNSWETGINYRGNFFPVSGVSVGNRIVWNTYDLPSPIVSGSTITIAAGANGTLNVPNNATVTIVSQGTNAVNNGDERIYMNIGSNAKVNWRANYRSSSFNTLVDVNGLGTLEVETGSINDTYNGSFNVSNNAAIRANSSTIIVSGGVVSAGTFKNAIYTSNGIVTVSGGEVRATTENAISSWGTSSSITISGGVVSATTGQAINADVNGTFRVTGGLVIAQRNIIIGANGVVNRNLNALSGNGTIIGYSLGTYNAGSRNGLISSPANVASWGSVGAHIGVYYPGDGFFPVSGVTLIAAPPGVPQNFSATPGNGRVTLNWTAPANNGGSPITSYEVSSNNGTSWVTASGNNSHTFTGLTNGTFYTFRVRAVNSAGAGTQATETATPRTIPAVPQNFTATSGNSQVSLNWTAPVNNGGSAITGYQVSSNNGVTWVTASSNTNHTFTDLTNGTLYTFRVRAVNEAGNGAEATTTATSGTPAVPQNFSAVAGNSQVSLSWTAPSSNGSVITDYLVSSNNGSSWILASSNTNHTFINLTNGTLYTFKVCAVNDSGIGAEAIATATPRTTPAVPQNFTANAGNGQVALSWTAPANNGGSIITGYQVSSDNGTNWVTASSNTSHTFTGLTNGTTYTFKVRAVNVAGNGEEANTTATPITVPTAPQNFTAEPDNGQVSLSWTAPANDEESPITGYQVSSNNGTSWITASSDTSHTFTSLTNGTSYTFRVRAINAAGNGAEASVTATPRTVPAAPQGFTAVAGNAQVSLNWMSPSTNGGSAITGYQVSSDNGTSWVTASNNTNHTFSGLTNGTTYTFKIRAVNIAGEGAEATATATPMIPTYIVTFSGSGSNGTISATVDGSNITFGTAIEQGKTVIFIAVPSNNYRVKEWTLNNTVVSGNSTNTYTLENLSAAATVTVSFERATNSAEITDMPIANVYPNPTDGLFTLDFEADGVHNLTLADISGKILFHETVTGQSVQIDISNYAAGVYLLKISNGKGQATIRIVKE